jgi:hypothetical protein
VRERLICVALPASLMVIPLALRLVLIKNKDDLAVTWQFILHGCPSKVRFLLLGEQVSKSILELPLELWISFKGDDLLEVWNGDVSVHSKFLDSKSRIPSRVT